MQLHDEEFSYSYRWEIHEHAQGRRRQTWNNRLERNCGRPLMQIRPVRMAPWRLSQANATLSLTDRG